MSTAVIAITPHGITVGKKIQEYIGCDLYIPQVIKSEIAADFISYDTSTKDLVARIWKKYRSLIFVMAMGAVVRIIRDHIEDKHKDPAVVVVDEMGRYAISLLSGHEGGANRVAEKVALICMGDFVITTGSEATRTLIFGMGCRRGTSVDELEKAMAEGLRLAGRNLSEVRLIASVEDKQDEKGFFQLSERLNIPLKFIPRTLIMAVEDNFAKSELVKKTLGVYSVAEPCAMLGGFRCRMILTKRKMKGITIAIAEERFLS